MGRWVRGQGFLGRQGLASLVTEIKVSRKDLS